MGFYAFCGIILRMADQSLFSVFIGLGPIFGALAPILWVVLPAVFFFFFKDFWLFWRQSIYKSAIRWYFLEMRIPSEEKRGPRAMEQFFNALYGLRNKADNFAEKFWDGEVTRWFSFEIVGKEGELRFYIRTPDRLRAAMEALLYAQYPDIELAEVEDYTKELPPTIPEVRALGLRVWGNELKLQNPAPYPINTYVDFENLVPGDERIIDPISVILEIVGKLGPRERIWMQFLVKPSMTPWHLEGEKIVEEIKQKAGFREMLRDGKPSFAFRTLSPIEEDTMKAISRKIDKPGFDTLTRYLYIAPLEGFNYDLPKRGILSYFMQYRNETLNYLGNNVSVRTDVSWRNVPYMFPNRRLKSRERKIYYKYQHRLFPEEAFVGRLSEFNIFSPRLKKKESVCILNSEELATLFHPPTEAVLTAPVLERVESRRVSPPSYIPYK